MKKIALLGLLLILGVFSLTRTYHYWIPYYNHYFSHYEYAYPSEQEFIVGVEPHHEQIPRFISNIIQLAFPDKTIVYTNDRKPHLIVRSQGIGKNEARDPKFRQWDAPYITYSIERYSIERNLLRENGLPIAEIVSAKPTNKRQLFFPFIVWSGLVPERVYTNNDRDQFLVYIASNCVETRDNLFALIKSKNPNAQALGVCSNPLKSRYPGSWGALDKVYSKYNFAFAMENHQVPGYMTEKIVVAFRGGAIPIYWGDSELAAEYFNPKAFIDVGEFNSLEEAADYIVELNNHPEKVEAMRAEPIFKDNIKPEMFRINDDDRHPLLQEAAQFVRQEFFKLITRKS